MVVLWFCSKTESTSIYLSLFFSAWAVFYAGVKFVLGVGGILENDHKLNPVQMWNSLC